MFQGKKVLVTLSYVSNGSTSANKSFLFIAREGRENAFNLLWMIRDPPLKDLLIYRFNYHQTASNVPIHRFRRTDAAYVVIIAL